MANLDKQVERARQALQEKEQEAQAEADRVRLEDRERPQDERDPRTKSSGQGKKAADKGAAPAEPRRG